MALSLHALNTLFILLMQIEQLMVSAFMLINPSETINYTAIANDIIDFETEIASVSRTNNENFTSTTQCVL